MAFGDPFKFYFTNPNTGDYYKWTRAAGVTQTGTPTALVFSPNGWMDTEVKWERSKTYWGLVRNFANPYKFVEDGMFILRDIFSTQGVNGACMLTIKSLVSNDGTYEILYSGLLDFDQYISARDYVQINIMEGGIVDAITNALDVQQQFILDHTTAESILLDGIYLQSKFNFSGVYQQRNLETNATPHNIGFMPVGYLSSLTNDNFNSGIGSDVFVPDPAFVPDLPYDYPFFTCYKAGDYDFYLKRGFTYFLNGTALAPIKIRIYIEIWSDNTPSGTMLDQAILYEDPVYLNPGDTRSFTVDEHYVTHMNSGNIAVIYVDDIWDVLGTPPSDVWQITFPDTNAIVLTVTGTFRLPASRTRAIRYYEFWAALIDTATTGAYTGTSSYLTDTGITKDDAYSLVPSNLYITIGDAIRGIDPSYNPNVGEDPYFKTTIANAIKCIFSVAGLGVNLDIPSGEAQLIPLSQILDKTTLIANLGEVSGLTVNIANDLLFNILNIGYPETQINNVLDGKYDYNDLWQWLLPLYKLSKAGDLVSPYFASPYYIEQLRQEYFNNITAQTNNDNNIFLIQATPGTPDATLFRPQNDFVSPTVEGIGDYNKAVAYNLGISPKRNMFRNGAYIHALCDLQDADVIKFKSANYNKNLITELDINGILAEITGTNISSFYDQLFKPYYLKFTCQIPKNLISLVNANPKGYFLISYRGIRLKGFPMEIGIYPATNNVYSVTLLVHPDIDMATLNSVQ